VQDEYVQLQTACINGDIDKVKSLVESSGPSLLGLPGTEDQNSQVQGVCTFVRDRSCFVHVNVANVVV
jgi:hypothetical protein